MRTTLVVATIAICSVGLDGCSSSISSTRLTYGSDNPGHEKAGIIYHLAATELQLDFQYELIDCDTQNIVIGVAGLGFTPVAVPDRSPDATYVIDIEKATGWTKQIDNFKVEVKNGLLSQVTYDVTDKTGAAIQDAAKTAARLGLRIALPAPIPETESIELMEAPVLDRGRPVPVCTPEAMSALAELQTLRAAAAQLREGLGTAIEAMSRKPSKENKDNVDRLLASLETVNTRIAAVRAGALRATYTKRFNPMGLGETMRIEADPIIFEKWLRIIGVGAGVERPGRESLLRVVNATAIEVEMAKTDKIAGIETLQKKTGNASGALFYRIPQIVQISLKNGDHLLLTQDVPIFQMGVTMPLVLENKIFQDNNFAVAFADGIPTTFNYVESLARLGVLMETMDKATATIGETELQEIEARKQLIEAQTKLAESEIKLIEAQRRLEEARGMDEGAEEP